MSEVVKPVVEAQPLRCPKGMKMPRTVKAMVAQTGKSKADQRYLMRSFGLAIHEQAAKNRSSAPRQADSNKD